MNRLHENAGFDQSTGSDVIQCLWMEAGVVDYKLCDRSYDCERCPFDEAVQSRSAKLIVATELFGDDDAKDTISVGGCEVAPELFFHSGHTWARIEDQGVIRTGLDDFGQRMLGRAYSLSLPALKTNVHQGKACGRVTHQSGVVALPAPVSGRVRETNPNLRQQPELVNHDPYGAGWIMLIEPTDLKRSLERLTYGKQVKQWLQTETEKLSSLINQTFDADQEAVNGTMTDGGLLTREFMSGLNVAQRRRIIKSFFPLSSIEETGNKTAIISSGR
jgi:glycine cleavage system H lipoate-binding protein